MSKLPLPRPHTATPAEGEDPPMEVMSRLARLTSAATAAAPPARARSDSQGSAPDPTPMDLMNDLELEVLATIADLQRMGVKLAELEGFRANLFGVFRSMRIVISRS